MGSSMLAGRLHRFPAEPCQILSAGIFPLRFTSDTLGCTTVHVSTSLLHLYSFPTFAVSQLWEIKDGLSYLIEKIDPAFFSWLNTQNLCRCLPLLPATDPATRKPLTATRLWVSLITRVGASGPGDLQCPPKRNSPRSKEHLQKKAEILN